MLRISRRRAVQISAAWAMSPALAPVFGAPANAPADPYADARFVPGEPPLPEPGSFTVAVLPDTQFYSETFHDQYHAQTEWIVAAQKERNIACVLHLGDITNRNTVAEWKVASVAMARLEGHVPYCLTIGNHDYSAKGDCQDRTTRFNEFFPLTRFREQPTFGGVYDREPDRLENNYFLFEAGGRKFLVVSLEFGPRADVVRWANEVVKRHADRAAILITHVYMYHDDTRYDWKKFGAKQPWNPHSYAVAKATNNDIHDGEELWTNLVSKHDNFVLTLNGHVLGDGLARIVTPTPGGRKIPQVLVNFQMKPKGGDGWLRLLEFKANGRTVEVFDFSPTRNEQNESPQNRFRLELPA